MAAGAYGSRRQLHDDVGDDGRGGGGVDAFSEEQVSRRPEVRLINTYAVLRTYVLMVLKGVGALVLLWATVVLLGGFVSSLKNKDFWFISVIAFVQAAGMFNAVFEYQLKHLMTWWLSAITKILTLTSSRVKLNRVHTQSQQTTISRVKGIIVFVMLYPVLTLCLYGPLICAGLSYWRVVVQKDDYGSGNKDAGQANLKPGLDLLYFLCISQGLMFILVVVPVELIGTYLSVKMVSQQIGLDREVVDNYCEATKLKYLKNLASSDDSWNLITYGAGLLDSEMPEDNVSGAIVLTALIEQGMPVRRQLLRSPRHRIQRLIGSLAWRSPAEGKMRWLATKIIENVAHDLSLAHFPGALECVSSLLDMSGYNKDGGHEAVNFVAQLRLDKEQGKQKDKKRVGTNSVQGTNEDLILQGLKILENLALDEHNCKLICSTDALFSKIVAPVSSENFIQDNTTNTAWSKVTDGSLKLLSKLMKCSSDTGKQVCRKISDNSRAVKNLEEVLAPEINSCSIIELQIRAIEILEQLCSGESTTTTNWASRERMTENLIIKVLHIFLTDQWMEDYLVKTRAMADEEIARQLVKSKRASKKSQQAEQALREIKMKAAQDTATRLKEKAGEALVTLCMGDQINLSDYIIRTFTGCGEAVRYLTEMLDSETRAVRCRYSAAVILKHLCTHCTTLLDHGYLKETTLKKVLEVLYIQTEAQATGRSKQIHDKSPPVPRHKQQLEERTLQVALLSLCTAIPDFASVVPQLVSPKDLTEKLKEIVEESRYATVSCLATVKLTCEIVMAALIPHDHLDINMKKEIVESLCQASETMAGLESCMLFAGADRDCYRLPVKPFCSDLVKQAQELLREKEQEMGLPNV